MKKLILFIITLIVIISLGFIILKDNPKSTSKVRHSFITDAKCLPYYKSNNIKRYQDYHKLNSNLSVSDVVTRVNLNLDLPYYTNTKEAKYLNTFYTLVNKYNYLRDDFVPNNLVEMTIPYSKEGIYLVEEARDNFYKLVDKAKEEGLTIRAISAYRGYTYQKRLYDKYVEADGVNKADTYSARPGFSDHQTGLAIDVDNTTSSFENFTNTKEYQWMLDNSYKYGFILRYPSGKESITTYQFESWHYRYVGLKLAKKIKASNLTFDEYFTRYLALS
ncbi:MAG: M15 family metallopeptidase [Bacilli bacterium]|jgi:LAS superfamily LD-carboxypeptidase LdcB|nr:M15 family metallopeptidase [Bacilli bacterium]